MRMWMVNPKIMCRNHLLGEYLECHMFLGSIKKKQNLKGYLENNLLEPRSLEKRHKALVKEMERRGFNHKSPLDVRPNDLNSLDNIKIDSDSSLKELLRRCKKCGSIQ